MYLSDCDLVEVNGQLGYFEYSYEMDGLGKFKIKKAFKKIGKAAKKVVKKVGKVIKKVAPIAAIGAGIWFAGPAIAGLAAKFGPAAAKLIASRAASKRQAETGLPDASATQAQVDAYIRQAEQEYLAQQGAPAGGYMPAAYGGGGYAPSAGNGYAPAEMMYAQQGGQAPGGLPQWAIPAAIAGAALLFVMTQRR